jgi:hypothetical protein
LRGDGLGERRVGQCCEGFDHLKLGQKRYPCGRVSGEASRSKIWKGIEDARRDWARASEEMLAPIMRIRGLGGVNMVNGETDESDEKSDESDESEGKEHGEGEHLSHFLPKHLDYSKMKS